VRTAWKYALDGRSGVDFYVPSATVLEGTKQDSLKSWVRTKYGEFSACVLPSTGENFDTYTARRLSFWSVKKLSPPTHSHGYFACTCPPYLQLATCKHSLGMAVATKLVQVPPQWKLNDIEKLRKRGRPPNVKHCLSKN
jgi:hypothetical protein